MKRIKTNVISSILVIVAILLIAVCFILATNIVENFAQDECFERIEEVTDQVSDMFVHTIQQSQTQLAMLADILGTNSSNPDELLQQYMEVFCETQNFSAVCIHRADGTTFSHGFHPHDEVDAPFASELLKVPYVSDVYSAGEKRSENYIYLATPVERNEETIAILYGYISLETFPTFISSTAYDGKSQFYIVDGKTGDFLMDEYHRYDVDGTEELPLSNAFDGSMSKRESKPGYSLETMQEGLKNGKSGYYIFKSQRTNEWYYTYYMPMGINAWNMQITIDEPTAFASYHAVRDIVVVLMTAVLVLCLSIIVILLFQTRRRAAQEAKRLQKADYLNKVQSVLLTAHHNHDFVDRALKLVCKETEAETALLLTFIDNTITNIYCWPSLDMNKAKVMIGVNIREEFPVMFDAMSSGESFFCDEKIIEAYFTPKAKALFHALSISNIMLIPIADAMGVLKGTIATLNTSSKEKSAEMIECVIKDFYMAISNLESHNIIKQMGTIDYLTEIKNRNCYEAELADYETVKAETLWCVFVDVNGLHELNNSKGHAAGDEMLRAVADAVKKVFGSETCYRMGGDEFVAFQMNSSHEEMMNCKNRILDTLAKKGYSVSIGFESSAKNANNAFDVEALVARAEAVMYQEKWKYYETNDIDIERKHIKKDEQN